jgi:hypothetical protein
VLGRKELMGTFLGRADVTSLRTMDSNGHDGRCLAGPADAGLIRAFRGSSRREETGAVPGLRTACGRGSIFSISYPFRTHFVCGLEDLVDLRKPNAD